ncbi:sensor histidine kinase [Catenulispora subtropica]|uniref:Signal transduction histidine kinase subgroup 3 dimerisation and phosphoacceptor domain-containing protein n=1 Tax=Catenulispora subtropica TaxID=450798 RepID=A0ABP5EXC5_9ACTN
MVVISFVVNGVINIRLDNAADHDTGKFAWSLVCIFAGFGMLLLHMTVRARRWPMWLKVLSLSAQAVITYFPYFVLHQLWGGLAGPLAGAILLLLPRPTAWFPFLAVVASMGPVATMKYHTADWISYYIISTMVLGLVVFGLTRLSELVRELAAARSELARMAVVAERLRFARDLHDLLGYSLSSITLKSELAYRLVPGQPDRARKELTEILQASRQALADVREVASSYREMSLTSEASSAQAMLETAEIDAKVDIDVGPLPPDLDTVLATTLREGVTNILRHSKVQHCSIRATQTPTSIRLEVANDGVTDQDDDDALARSGSGLGNLRTRLSAFDGTLTAGVSPDRWFRLTAEVPRTRAATNSGG